MRDELLYKFVHTVSFLGFGRCIYENCMSCRWGGGGGGGGGGGDAGGGEEGGRRRRYRSAAVCCCQIFLQSSQRTPLTKLVILFLRLTQNLLLNTLSAALSMHQINLSHPANIPSDPLLLIWHLRPIPWLLENVFCGISSPSCICWLGDLEDRCCCRSQYFPFHFKHWG